MRAEISDFPSSKILSPFLTRGIFSSSLGQSQFSNVLSSLQQQQPEPRSVVATQIQPELISFVLAVKPFALTIEPPAPSSVEIQLRQPSFNQRLSVVLGGSYFHLRVVQDINKHCSIKISYLHLGEGSSGTIWIQRKVQGAWRLSPYH